MHFIKTNSLRIFSPKHTLWGIIKISPCEKYMLRVLKSLAHTAANQALDVNIQIVGRLEIHPLFIRQILAGLPDMA